MRRVGIMAVTVLVVAAACSASSHHAAPIPTGMIVGSMYIVGGAPPPTPAPVNGGAVLGAITVRSARGQEVVARPIQDSHGDFHLNLPPGRYVVQGAPAAASGLPPLTQTVLVRSGATAKVDLVYPLG